MVSRRVPDLTNVPVVKVNNDVINFESKVKNLGFIMNSTLTWDDQIIKTTQTLFYGIRCLWATANLFPIDVKLKLAKSLLIPHIIYIDTVVGDLDSNNFKTLQKAFNSIVRFVFNRRKYDHISDVSNKILGLSLKNFLKFRRLIFMYTILSTKKPEYLYSKLDVLPSARLQKLRVPRFNYSPYGRSFFICDIVNWNSLPLNIRNKPNLHSFKESLYNYLSN